MTAPAVTVSEFKTGTCDWCRNDGEVYTDNDLCEQCDSDIVHCSVCDQDQHYDDPCRHVFRDEDYEWSGSGVGAPSEVVKKSFFVFLDCMPPAFGPALSAAIKTGRFHTWMTAPLIGGGGHITFHGMRRDDDTWAWSDALFDVGEGERAEAARDGYRWTVSLYDAETPKANTITLDWISERER
jgi:hypothetical protein